MEKDMELNKLGWNDFFETEFLPFKEQGLVPGRIIKDSRQIYEIITAEGSSSARVAGHFQYTAVCASDYPVTGDWVALRNTDDTFIIEKVLKRKTAFSRKAAGRETEEQVIAANIDTLCIVCGLDGGRNFNLRGVERFLAMSHESGADSIIILNKADLCSEKEEALLDAKSVAGTTPVFIISALTGEGIQSLRDFFAPFMTIAFTGHSGVGKSALVNCLMSGEVQKTGELRRGDLRGRHTTTHREIFFLPGEVLVIDTPGLRELQLWGDESSLYDVFTEIAEASENCRFRDCTHQEEPGCAVQKLLIDGELSYERYQNYLDMRKELAYLKSRQDEKGRNGKKAKDKELSKILKDFNKNRR